MSQEIYKLALGLSSNSLPLLQRLKQRGYANKIALTPLAANEISYKNKDLLVGSASKILKDHWKKGAVFILVGATGAIARLIAPFLTNKEEDPAVLAMDQRGFYVIPMLGGHKAGAEDLALELAEDFDAKAIITSNSRCEGILSLDSFGDAWGWKRSGDINKWNKLIFDNSKHQKLIFNQDSGSTLWQKSIDLKGNLQLFNNEESSSLAHLEITSRKINKCAWHPPTLWIGIGCERNTDLEIIESSIDLALDESNLAKEAVAGLSSIDIKSDELGLLSFSKKMNWPIRFFEKQDLAKVRVPNPSSYVKSIVGTSSVAEASALLAAGANSILLQEKKIFRTLSNKKGSVSIAIAESEKPFAPKRGELHLVGIGPGDLAYLTPDARSALARTVIWIGYSRYLDFLEPIRRNDQIRIDGKLTFEIDRCKEAIELAEQGIKVALISSGDSGIYGLSGLALEIWLKQAQENRPELEIHPGLSAMQLAASKIGAPFMQDFCVISLSDKLNSWTKIEKKLILAAQSDVAIALYNPQSQTRNWQLNRAIEILKNFRSGQTPIVIARQMGRAEEEVQIFTLDNAPFSEVDMLTIVLVANNQSLLKDGWLFAPRGYKT